MDLSQKKINDEFAVVAAIVLSSNEFQQPHDYSEKNVDHCKKILPLKLANEQQFDFELFEGKYTSVILFFL